MIYFSNEDVNQTSGWGSVSYITLCANGIFISGPQFERYIWISNPCFLMIIKILFWGIIDTNTSQKWIKTLFLWISSWQPASSGSFPDIVNRALLIHSYTHLFTYYHWLLCATTEGCDRHHMSHKTKNIYSGLHRTILPTSAPDSLIFYPK